MLSESDWDLWLDSNETKAAINLIKNNIVELKEIITNGSNIQEKSIEKISLDYAYALGQLDGLQLAIDTLKDEE